MRQLLNRKYEFTVGDIGGESLTFTGNLCNFVIKKTSTSDPNKADISMTNLSPTERSFIKKGQGMIFKAGYLSDFGTVFKGTVDQFDTDDQSVDIITKIESKDGIRKLNDNFVIESFAPGVKLRTIVDKIVKSAGLTVGSIKDIPDITFNNGLEVSKGFKFALDELLENEGLQWNIQDGQLYIVKENKPVNTTVILLNNASGLIGGPPKPKEDGWIFKSLIRPGLNPGKIVKVESPELDAFITIQNSTFTGNSRSGPWFVDIEGVEKKL